MTEPNVAADPIPTFEVPMSETVVRMCSVVTSAEQFWQWVNNSNPGDFCEYYRGLSLLADSGKRSEPGNIVYEKRDVGNAAWEAYMFGQVVLFTKRNCLPNSSANYPDNKPFTFFAQKRRGGSVPPLWGEGLSKLAGPKWRLRSHD